MSKRGDTLAFKDLTIFDVDLIKSLAMDKFKSQPNVNAQTAMIEIVFDCIKSKGYDIVKSDREPTWSEPRESWYTPAPKHNDWWKKNE